FSGDGSLDHHVLVAAFWAFYPELVAPIEGGIEVTPPSREELQALDPELRSIFLHPLPSGEGVVPVEATVQRIWALRNRIAGPIARGQAPWRIAQRAGVPETDVLLRLAVLATVLPHRVRLRAAGFDLAGLAQATQEHTFQGLYPYIRAIACYPAGTAADNALYAGVPGWSYAQASRYLTRYAWLDGWRRSWEDRLTARFVAWFKAAVVVPARFSVVAFDDEWQAISSHAAGGPGGGRFFQADLEAKTGGLLGYLLRIPQVLWNGALDDTVVAVRAETVEGAPKMETTGRMVEAMFSNRAFIGGLGAIPSTNPTSFAGQSSLVMGPALWYRDGAGRLQADLTGLLTFFEAVVKGVLGRALHLVGVGAGTLGGGGRFLTAKPHHQITLTEGESARLDFMGPGGRPRYVPTQVSGDPYQATSMQVRVAWGPLPLLAGLDSLLLAAAQRSLTRLRQVQSWQLQVVYVGGLAWFRHRVGRDWSQAFCEETGLFAPPVTLPRNLGKGQGYLLRLWSALGAGRFVDTTEQGLSLGRRGRYAHNNDQTCHLVMLRERGTLLVRQVRKAPDGRIYEARTTYRSWFGGWVVHDSQTRSWTGNDAPSILMEEHYFRDAEAFRLDAPGFFPFVAGDEDGKVLRDVTSEIEGT
ncbi:MAG: hypothetical protein KC656_12255, partial [Myxococcales bacterium]|nr:hypothetical protein [Myxococcales bacterium]